MFFWVFGIAAGWANACLLQDRPFAQGHGRDAAMLAHQDGAVARGVASFADADAGLEACVSFCDSEQRAIPKLELPALAAFDVAHATTVVAWAPRVVEHTAGLARLLAPPRPPGPPVAIRFLRLTI